MFYNLLGVVGTSCVDGEGYIYSNENWNVQRCRDNKEFFYTELYENMTTCSNSWYVDEGACWLDTSVESHCLESSECIWLSDVSWEGLCYCSESIACPICNDQTPAPTYDTSTSNCPDNCKLWYLGCVGMYCNCRGECSASENFGCTNPVGASCFLWYTDNPSPWPTPVPIVLPISMPTEQPTTKPSSATEYVSWGTKLCCIEEVVISWTIPGVAAALGVPNEQVAITNYALAARRRELDSARRREGGESWDIDYAIELIDPSETTTDDLIANIQDDNFLDSVADMIGSQLDVILEQLETTSLQ